MNKGEHIVYLSVCWWRDMQIKKRELNTHDYLMKCVIWSCSNRFCLFGSWNYPNLDIYWRKMGIRTQHWRPLKSILEWQAQNNLHFKRWEFKIPQLHWHKESPQIENVRGSFSPLKHMLKFQSTHFYLHGKKYRNSTTSFHYVLWLGHKRFRIRHFSFSYFCRLRLERGMI